MTTMTNMAKALLSLLIINACLVASTVAQGETCEELTASYKSEKKALNALKRKQLALENKNEELDQARADLEAHDQTLASSGCAVPTDAVQSIGELVLSELSGSCADLLAKAEKKKCEADTSKSSCTKLAFQLCENGCTHVEDVSDCALETGHVPERCAEAVDARRLLANRVNQLEEGVKRKRAALQAKADLVKAIKAKMVKVGCPIPPEDGEWGAWAPWGACSAACGTGSRSRSRQCDDPEPSNGGAPCAGDASDTESCNTKACSVDSAWGSWSRWGGCSTTCGGGSRARNRKCDSPAPALGGQKCSGSALESGSCNNYNCPRDGGWNVWSAWTACSATCGGGSRTRARKCNMPAPMYGGKACAGAAQDSDTCNTQACPNDGAWGTWSRWGGCSTTCGGGSRARSRFCNSPAPAHGGKTCPGSALDSGSCNNYNCPRDGGWNVWTAWSACSKTCGSGSRTRARKCNLPAPMYGGKACAGAAQDSDTCNTQTCASPQCVGRADGAWRDYKVCKREYNECVNGKHYIRKCNIIPFAFAVYNNSLKRCTISIRTECGLFRLGR